jgi:hypothetical protein
MQQTVTLAPGTVVKLTKYHGLEGRVLVCQPVDQQLYKYLAFQLEIILVFLTKSCSLGRCVFRESLLSMQSSIVHRCRREQKWNKYTST